MTYFRTLKIEICNISVNGRYRIELTSSGRQNTVLAVLLLLYQVHHGRIVAPRHCAIAACCAGIAASEHRAARYGCSPVKSEWGTRSFIRFSSEGGSDQPRVPSARRPVSLASAQRRACAEDALFASDWTCNLSRALMRAISRSKDGARVKEGLGINIYSPSHPARFAVKRVSRKLKDG